MRALSHRAELLMLILATLSRSSHELLAHFLACLCWRVLSRPDERVMLVSDWELTVCDPEDVRGGVSHMSVSSTFCVSMGKSLRALFLLNLFLDFRERETLICISLICAFIG